MCEFQAFLQLSLSHPIQFLRGCLSSSKSPVCTGQLFDHKRMGAALALMQVHVTQAGSSLKPYIEPPQMLNDTPSHDMKLEDSPKSSMPETTSSILVVAPSTMKEVAEIKP